MQGETPTPNEIRGEPIRDLPYLTKETYERFLQEEIKVDAGTTEQRAARQQQIIDDFRNDNDVLFYFASTFARGSKDPKVVMQAVAQVYRLLRYATQEERRKGAINI